MTAAPRLVIHVGYPKTATTTLQRSLFETSRELHYLGKFVPSHRYVDERLWPLLDVLLLGYEREWVASRLVLRRVLMDWMIREPSKTCVLSTENFVHPWSLDPAIIAQRLAEIAPQAQILMVVREQVSMLTSFYRWHGGFGQYLFLNKYVDEPCVFPLAADAWMHFQEMAPTRNVLGLLDFDRTVGDFEDAFGPDNVHVMTYETLRADEHAFAAALARVLRIAPDDCAARLAGARFNSEGDTSVPEAAKEPLADRFSPAVADRIRRRFAAGNAALDRRRALSLAQLGYAM
jgi:hypothetical protein